MGGPPLAQQDPIPSMPGGPSGDGSPVCDLMRLQQTPGLSRHLGDILLF